MKQEERDLLLKDLCARLPYKVKCDISNHEDSYYDSYEHIEIHLKDKKPIKISGIDFNKDCIYLSDSQIDHVCGFENYGGLKPYLRPMTSMTEDEIVELKWLSEKCDAMPSFRYVPVENYRIYDWMNRHHFDYRGLIEKNLALEAPEGMYQIE